MSAVENFKLKWLEDRRFKALCESLNGIFGNFKMESHRVSDLDACIWFCTHIEKIQAGKIPSRTIDAFAERFELSFKKYKSGEHWLVETGTPFGALGYINGKFFTTLLEAGYLLDKYQPGTGISGKIVGLGDEVMNASPERYERYFILTDISDCQLYWDRHYNVIALKREMVRYNEHSERAFCAKGTLENRYVDDKVDAIFNFCESEFKENVPIHPDQQYKESLLNLITFLGEDKDKISAYMVDWYLRYKINTPEINRKKLATRCAMETFIQQSLSAMLGEEITSEVMNLYYLSGETKTPIAYIRNTHSDLSVEDVSLPDLS